MLGLILWTLVAPGRADCLPETGGPYWMEEGQTLAVKVTCASGRSDAWDVTPLPSGATFDRVTGELRFSPRLDQAGVHHLSVRAASTGEVAALVIGVADRFDDPANVPIVSPREYTHEMGLPVVHLTVPPDLGEEFRAATVVYRGHVHRAEAKVRGRSSLEYPKQHYTLKFAGKDRFHEPAVGIHGRRKMALTSTFDDNSLVRQRMAFELWNRASPGTVRIRTSSVVVYLNGRYHGVYTLGDHIDDDLLAGEGFAPTGPLFKAVGHDAKFAPGPFPHAAFEKRGRGGFGELEALAALVGGADDVTFRAQIGRRIHLEDVRAWFALATTIQAMDTLAKNAYYFRDGQTGRFRVVLWDFNHSFGQDWMTAREPPRLEPAYLATWNHLFERLLADPVLGPETRAQAASLLRNELALPSVLALFDGLASEVAVSAPRDERRWRLQYLAFPRWSARGDFTDFTREITYTRRWIQDRWYHLLVGA